jgi:hypothetical protein
LLLRGKKEKAGVYVQSNNQVFKELTVMKRIITILLFAALAFGMVGCACTQDSRKCLELCQTALDKAQQMEQSCENYAKQAQTAAMKAEAAARRNEAAADRSENIFMKPVIEPERVKKKILKTPLFWNLLAQKKPYEPLEVLKKSNTYTIVLDLSALEYPFKKITTKRPGKGIIDLIIDKLTDSDEIKLSAYLLPDTKYFENPGTSKRIENLTINVKKIRDFEDPRITPGKIMDHLRDKGKDSEYVFGHVELQLQTKENADSGWGSVAVVLFDKNSKRPLDEIVTHFCIEKCDAKKKPKTAPTSLKGIDTINAADEGSSLPDASLYFLEFEESIHGVFCDNSDSSVQDLNCFSWHTPNNIASLNNTIKRIATDLDPISSETQLDNIGDQISSLLFPEDDTLYKRFKVFVSKKIEEAKSSPKRPSIFLRVVTSGGQLAPFLPLGLASFNYKEGQKAILGEHFRIVSPLPVQSYSIKKDCISERVALLPPQNITDIHLSWAIKGMGSVPALGGKPYNDLIDFRKNYLQNPSITEMPTALFILSHHDNNVIYFENRKQCSISAQQIRHHFASPSISILNTCGTSVPDSSEFVYNLNSHGVETVIATSSSMDAFTAGKFFYCINQYLLANKANRDYAVSLLFDDAIKCLWEERNSFNTQIGANAFKYVLLGNGDVPLCLE